MRLTHVDPYLAHDKWSTRVLCRVMLDNRLPADLGYSHRGQEFSEHVAELPKHHQVVLGARTFWVRATSSVSGRQPWCTVKIVTNRG